MLSHLWWFNLDGAPRPSLPEPCVLCPSLIQRHGHQGPDNDHHNAMVWLFHMIFLKYLSDHALFVTDICCRLLYIADAIRAAAHLNFRHYSTVAMANAFKTRHGSDSRIYLRLDPTKSRLKEAYRPTIIDPRINCREPVGNKLVPWRSSHVCRLKLFYHTGFINSHSIPLGRHCQKPKITRPWIAPHPSMRALNYSSPPPLSPPSSRRRMKLMKHTLSLPITITQNR